MDAESLLLRLGHGIQTAIGYGIPLLIVALIIRRKMQKRRFYAQPEETAPIEGTLEELHAVDPAASPWPNDQRRKLSDTKELVGRYNTLDGYSDEYVEDLMVFLRGQGIACDYVFQETLPMGVAAAIVNRVGTYEVFADRERFDEAMRAIDTFKSR